MRGCAISVLAWVILATGFSLSALGSDLSFEGGDALLRVDAGTGGAELTLTAAGTETPAPHTWVITVEAGRFEDGIFGWQLHFSEGHDSVLVIPNDFLTARVFTTAQLGMEIREHVPGTKLVLFLPSDGPIPNLLAQGDRVTIHALWLQQDPLGTMQVEEDLSASAVAGGGASMEARDESETYLPVAAQFRQGELIRHAFRTPPDDGTAREASDAASYSLLRIHDQDAVEFIRFSHIPYDAGTGMYTYEIPTDRLAPGLYRLIVWTEAGNRTEQGEIEILER